MIANIEVERDLWFANPLPTGNGFTWTLASRLGDILHIAEQLYGSRNGSYTILGVEFCGAVPQIWYPGNCGHIVVQITPQCATDMQRACYQMAHEAIHLLSPTGEAQTNVLEEGLATHFSMRYMHNQFNAVWGAGLGHYQDAQVLIGQLLALDGDIIRRIRETQPTLAAITADNIRAANAAVSPELAASLTQPFVYA